jgi:hypothetical protein
MLWTASIHADVEGLPEVVRVSHLIHQSSMSPHLQPTLNAHRDEKQTTAQNLAIGMV